jgi:hypothetical protein
MQGEFEAIDEHGLEHLLKLWQRWLRCATSSRVDEPGAGGHPGRSADDVVVFHVVCEADQGFRKALEEQLRHAQKMEAFGQFQRERPGENPWGYGRTIRVPFPCLALGRFFVAINTPACEFPHGYQRTLK